MVAVAAIAAVAVAVAVATVPIQLFNINNPDVCSISMVLSIWLQYVF
jgi:hypothetical protein